MLTHIFRSQRCRKHPLAIGQAQRLAPLRRTVRQAAEQQAPSFPTRCPHIVQRHADTGHLGIAQRQRDQVLRLQRADREAEQERIAPALAQSVSVGRVRTRMPGRCSLS